MPPRSRVTTIALLAAFPTACGTSSPAPDGGGHTERRDPRARVPGDVQHTVHTALHALPRLCRGRRPNSRALDRTTLIFIRYYKRYPSRRFRLQIDDESGTMLSAVLVLRQELSRCSPRLTVKVDTVLPADVRQALPAPGKATKPPGRGQ